ncbi:hypothetical protein ALISP_6699 [Alicycliphilus sp. B1]|nr:hypothetical protein ALISP_6699 [Alicycliphilus sp. B1]
MSLITPERLYQLLPAIHRLRDAEQGLPLRALLAVIEQELTALEADTARLYDNWFIETCDEWTVPYIGDLVGARPIRPVPSAGVSARAWVANTLAYRRRKGTALVLEQLARDVTGWPAAAVEFFQRLATTQHMNHVRLASAATASVRDAARADLACASAGAFDPFAHLLEVRNADTAGGRFNIPNVGIFLWRLRAQPLGQGRARRCRTPISSARAASAAGWWHMHPAGVDAPLFNLPRTETGGAVTQAAREENARRAAAPAGPACGARTAARRRCRYHPRLHGPGTTPYCACFVRLAGEALPVEIAREGLWICDIPRRGDAARPATRGRHRRAARPHGLSRGARRAAGLAACRAWQRGRHRRRPLRPRRRLARGQRQPVRRHGGAGRCGRLLRPRGLAGGRDAPAAAGRHGHAVRHAARRGPGLERAARRPHRRDRADGQPDGERCRAAGPSTSPRARGS